MTERGPEEGTRVEEPRGRGPLTRLLGRASLNLVDQVLSALTNVVLSFLVARAVSADGYGAFAIAFIVFGLFIGIERSLIGQPLSIRFSAAVGEQRTRSVGAAYATTLVVTGLSALVIAGVGAFLGGTLGATLIALAIVLPGLILQDTCRMVFFAHRRPLLAVINDSTWAVVQFAAMGVLYARGVEEPWPYVLAWGGAATVAALVGLVQLGILPRFGQVRWWIRGQIDISGYLLMEYLIGAGSAQGSILLVGGVGSIGDVGSLRAAQTLLGPLGIVSTALMSFALPEVSQRTDLSSRTRMRLAGGISVGIVVLSLVYAGVLLLIPDGLGTQLLGDTWSGARSVLLPLALASTAAGASLGPAVLIYAMGRARRTFALHVVEAPLLVACMASGVFLGGTVGAAWGMALSMSLMVPLWFWQLRVLVGQPVQAPEEPARA